MPFSVDFHEVTADFHAMRLHPYTRKIRGDSILPVSATLRDKVSVIAREMSALVWDVTIIRPKNLRQSVGD
jgi:hypothetical protein